MVVVAGARGARGAAQGAQAGQWAGPHVGAGRGGDIVEDLNPGDVLQMSRFAVSAQVRRGSGLFAPTRTMLLSYQYGKLRNVVVRHMCKRKGVTMHEGSEAYTTKQCCFCGHVLSKEDMPLGEKTFNCTECGAKAHRDGKAAFMNVVKHVNADMLIAILVPAVVVAAGTATTTRRSSERALREKSARCRACCNTQGLPASPR